jgi:hypothetical protein
VPNPRCGRCDLPTAGHAPGWCAQKTPTGISCPVCTPRHPTGGIDPKVNRLRDDHGDEWVRCGPASWRLVQPPARCGCPAYLSTAELVALYGPLTPTEWVSSHGLTRIRPGPAVTITDRVRRRLRTGHETGLPHG